MENLEYIKNAATELSNYITNYKIIVTKSTLPVGTTLMIKDLIKSKTNHEFDVAANPEFLKEGSAVNDFMFPDRIVVGVESVKAEKILKEANKHDHSHSHSHEETDKKKKLSKTKPQQLKKAKSTAQKAQKNKKNVPSWEIIVLERWFCIGSNDIGGLTIS